MAAGRGDAPEAGRGRLRASHADREQVIGTLKAAFVQGMLAKDEFDQRVDQALAARTHAELATLTADIPAGIPAAQPPRTPAQIPGKAAKAAICVSLALALLTVAVFLEPGGDINGSERLIWLAVIFLPVAGLFTGGLLLLHSRLEKRSRGQLPRGPAPNAGGQVSRRLPLAGPDRQLPSAGHGDRHAAEASRSRPRQRRPGAGAVLRAS